MGLLEVYWLFCFCVQGVYKVLIHFDILIFYAIFHSQIEWWLCLRKKKIELVLLSGEGSLRGWTFQGKFYSEGVCQNSYTFFFVDVILHVKMLRVIVKGKVSPGWIYYLFLPHFMWEELLWGDTVFYGGELDFLALLKNAPKLN